MYERMYFQTAVFAAFRARQIQDDLLWLAVSEHGVITPFEEYYNLALTHLGNTFGNHLQTECDQLVKRMHEWAEWEEFKEHEDILPNLKWMPTTSYMPDHVHQVFWEIPVIRPIHDPFWKEYRPGDHWGCKCTLEATDEDVTPLEKLPNPKGYKASLGMVMKVGHRGMLIDSTHPAFNGHEIEHPVKIREGRKDIADYVYDIVVGKYGIRPPKSTLPQKDWTASEDGLYYTTPTGVRIHAWADYSEIEDNLRVALDLKRAYPQMDIEVAEDLPIFKRPNPEFLIDGELGDGKRIRKHENTGNAIGEVYSRQRGSVAIIDLDKHLRHEMLKSQKIARSIFRRKSVDFDSGHISTCYVIYQGLVAKIEATDVNNGIGHLQSLLEHALLK